MDRLVVFINVAMTTDSKIDSFERKGTAISSQSDRERVERLRAESDAVMAGGRTLLDEDPKLTVKSKALVLVVIGRIYGLSFDYVIAGR
jgi:2,5-diamino-6-(ribosylamino)-4(3H)-pyrimidinone 5'-phosphate reductase